MCTEDMHMHMHVPGEHRVYKRLCVVCTDAYAHSAELLSAKKTRTCARHTHRCICILGGAAVCKEDGKREGGDDYAGEYGEPNIELARAPQCHLVHQDIPRPACACMHVCMRARIIHACHLVHQNVSRPAGQHTRACMAGMLACACMHAAASAGVVAARHPFTGAAVVGVLRVHMRTYACVDAMHTCAWHAYSLGQQSYS